MSLTITEYFHILHERINLPYLNGGELQTIGHIVGIITDNLRKSYLELPVVGGYFLYKWDTDYFYMVKAVYGTQTRKASYTNYKMKRPIKHCHPSEYETLLIGEHVDEIKPVVQTNLFGE